MRELDDDLVGVEKTGRDIDEFPKAEVNDDDNSASSLESVGVGEVGDGDVSSLLTNAALTNNPQLGLQLKYLLPCTLPSCFPSAAGSSNPIQVPLEKETVPIYFTLAIFRLSPTLTNTLSLTLKKQVESTSPLSLLLQELIRR